MEDSNASVLIFFSLLKIKHSRPAIAGDQINNSGKRNPRVCISITSNYKNNCTINKIKIPITISKT